MDDARQRQQGVEQADRQRHLAAGAGNTRMAGPQLARGQQPGDQVDQADCGGALSHIGRAGLQMSGHAGGHQQQALPDARIFAVELTDAAEREGME